MLDLDSAHSGCMRKARLVHWDGITGSRDTAGEDTGLIVKHTWPGRSAAFTEHYLEVHVAAHFSIHTVFLFLWYTLGL